MTAPTGLRDDQRKATRARIVAAVTSLVDDEHPAAISVPAVAARAGVGVATVYRYFPNKETLLDAAAYASVTPDAARLPDSFEDVGDSLRTAWGQLAEQMPLVRAQVASPAGRELHHRRWEAKHAYMAELAHQTGIDPATEPGRRLLGLADVLTSSTALLELHGKAGVAADDAAAWCAWAVRILHDATKQVLAEEATT